MVNDVKGMNAEKKNAWFAMKTWRSRVSTAIVAGFALIAATLAIYGGILPVQAKGGEVYTGMLSDAGAGGYDVVAFFREGKPVVGNTNFTHVWRGATWRFSSASYRAAFVADPAAFAPAYGGHCAWAAANGYKASGDPLQWRIVDGRLFLNYNAEVKTRWEANIPGFITSADQNWITLAKK
jgi:hypothetical protein